MILNFLFNKKANPTEVAQDPLAQFQATGDPHYCGLIYQEYSHMISALCYKYMRREVDAEDAAAEVFEIMLRDLPGTEVQNLSNWIYTVTKNHCLKTLRKVNKDGAIEEISEKNENSFVESDPQMDLLDEDGLENQLNSLEQALKQLPSHQQQCVELFFIKGKSYKDIESDTDFTLNEIKSHIQNGKRRLKIILQAAHQ